MAKHLWETPACGPASAHPWEDDEGPAACDVASGLAADSDSSGDECAKDPTSEFINFLILLLLTRCLNAREFCTVMFWASKCGIAAAGKYGYSPGAPSGHFQRHCDKVVEPLRRRSHLYEFEAPGANPTKLGRGRIAATIVPPHEAVDETLGNDSGASLKLEEACTDNLLPASYYSDPVVTARGAGKVWPLGLFIDGVEYSQQDSVIGFWFVCLVTGARWLTATLRKQTLCDCGCRGWDTLREVMSVIAWSVRAFREGVWPSTRHDGTHWRPSETDRAQAAGKAMRFPCVLVHIRGDWSEYANTLGMPGWHDGLRPCYKCNCSTCTMHSWRGSERTALVWRPNEEADYDAACARCEHWVELNEASHKQVLDRLAYDRRKEGSRGRALTEDIDGLNLLAGDRLEPFDGLRDVGDFEKITTFPARVLFWRPSSETLARRRCPLLDRTLNTSPAKILTVDLMHTLYLGVMLAFVRKVVWFFMLKNAWAAGHTVEETVAMSAVAMQQDMRRWLREHAQKNPTDELTPLPIKRKTFGDPADKGFRAKAAQTWTMLLYLQHVARARAGLLGPDGQRIAVALDALVGMVRVFQKSPPRMPPGDCAAAWEKWKCFVATTVNDAEVQVPKLHLMFHLHADIPWHGNPRMYAVWRDETLNRVLKMACRQVSQQTFDASLLVRFPYIMEELDRKSAKKPRHDCNATAETTSRCTRACCRCRKPLVQCILALPPWDRLFHGG